MKCVCDYLHKCTPMQSLSAPPPSSPHSLSFRLPVHQFAHIHCATCLHTVCSSHFPNFSMNEFLLLPFHLRKFESNFSWRGMGHRIYAPTKTTSHRRVQNCGVAQTQTADTHTHTRCAISMWKQQMFSTSSHER